MSGSVIARIALIVAAVAAGVVLIAFQRSEDSCTDSVKALFFALKNDEQGAQLDKTIGSVEDDCPGSARLVDAGGVLYQQREPARAARMLREAVDREPDSFSAWAGLAVVLAKSDPAAADAAAARAHSLNPYYRRPS